MVLLPVTAKCELNFFCAEERDEGRSQEKGGEGRGEKIKRHSGS